MLFIINMRSSGLIQIIDVIPEWHRDFHLLLDDNAHSHQVLIFVSCRFNLPLLFYVYRQDKHKKLEANHMLTLLKKLIQNTRKIYTEELNQRAITNAKMHNLI